MTLRVTVTISQHLLSSQFVLVREVRGKKIKNLISTKIMSYTEISQTTTLRPLCAPRVQSPFACNFLHKRLK